MKLSFIKIAILFTVLCNCTNKDKETQIDKQTYQQQKESLLDREKKFPKSFLNITGKYNRNFWGQSVYRGTIHNTATVCIYKNVRVKLLFFKTDGTLVTNHEELFDETIKPGAEIEFKSKYKTPRGTDSVVASIMSAVAEK